MKDCAVPRGILHNEGEGTVAIDHRLDCGDRGLRLAPGRRRLGRTKPEPRDVPYTPEYAFRVGHERLRAEPRLDRGPELGNADRSRRRAHDPGVQVRFRLQPELVSDRGPLGREDEVRVTEGAGFAQHRGLERVSEVRNLEREGA